MADISPNRRRKSSSSSPAKPKPTPSPRRQQKAKAEVETGAVVDPSVWRKSAIPKDEKITTKTAMENYRLKTEGLKELVSEHYPGTASGWSANLYNHREVERKAWEMHGGPDAWDVYLENLRQKPRRGNLFHEPETNGVALATLYALAKKFSQTWIWDKCIEELDRHGAEGYLREHYLKLALTTLPTYPRRPSVVAAETPSVAALREILSRAPDSTDHPNMEEFPDLGETFHDWSSSYVTEIYNALSVVIKELGVDSPGGWHSVRWEVYDTVSKSRISTLRGCSSIYQQYERSMGSIFFKPSDDIWGDSAQIWIAGKAEPGTLDHNIRSQCPTGAGLAYNERLPVLNDRPQYTLRDL
ncbi:hypothetical protein DXG01_006230 [Tephrocybe rancida]|nr:hypothetical protein DXG01_006230 [Tephrocybe rancida]